MCIRDRFKGKAFLETFILFGMMFPIQLGVLVNYQVINAMGLISTLFGLMLVYIGNMSLACFLFMKFFKQLPGELSESAKICLLYTSARTPRERWQPLF